MVALFAGGQYESGNYGARQRQRRHTQQSVLQDMFAMIMLADIGSATVAFDQLVKNLEQVGEDNNLKIHVMHEDIFNSMHKI